MCLRYNLIAKQPLQVAVTAGESDWVGQWLATRLVDTGVIFPKTLVFGMK